MLHLDNTKRSRINGSTSSINYRHVQCSILKAGISPVLDVYYLCECDPERRNPICEECFRQCHVGDDHKEIKRITKEDVCMCGFKCHQPMNQAESVDEKYTKQCLFGEWASECKMNVFFKDKNEPNSLICLMCKNICYKNSESMMRVELDSKSEGSNHFGEAICTCSNHNHNDIRIIFRKLRSVVKKNNFVAKYNFEGFTFIQFMNIIFRGSKSFDNLFHSFSDKIYETVNKITNSPDYLLEDHKFINDLHLTSNILSDFALKCKNVYSFNKDEENNQNVSDISSEYGESRILRINCKSLLYFREEIKNILTSQKYFAILKKKFDFKSRNIWQLKYFLTNIYWAFCIGRDFIKYPNIKLRDIILLNPIQRLMLISNIKKENDMNDYLNNLNDNLLDSTLNLLFKISKANENQNEILIIYNKLYKICQLFAKYSLFNHEQVSKFCNVNNRIILFFLNSAKTEAITPEQEKLKFKVLSPMMKCLLYLAYNFNDQMLISFLRKERNLHNVNFFHMKNDICKLLSKNAINCLTLIQEITPDFRIENFQADGEEDKKKKIKKKKSRKVVNPDNSDSNQDSPLFNYYEEHSTNKILRNIISSANSIINLVLDVNENYATGLTRLTLSKNIELAFNYLNSNLNDNELDFVLKVRNCVENLESTFFNFFDSYDHNSNKTTELNEILARVIAECKIGNLDFKAHTQGASLCFDEEKLLVKNGNKGSAERDRNLIEDDSKSLNDKYISFRKQKKGDKSSVANDEVDEETKIKILINKTYLIPSMFKIIQVLYNLHLSQDKDSKFEIESNLFKKIQSIGFFYIRNSVENSLFFLISDITSSIELLNDTQLFSMLDLVENALQTIYLFSAEITSNTNLLHLLKIAVMKSQNNVQIINKILKIIQIVIHINFNNERNTLKKLRKTVMNLYNKAIEAKVSCKNLLVPNSENKMSDKIIKKFLRIVNHLFEGNSILEERKFYESIFTKEEIKKILKKTQLNISIRTEILIYYRIAYIDTIMKKSHISYYTSLLINEPIVKKTEENIENQKYFRFFENLIKSGSNTIIAQSQEQIESLADDCEIIKHELINCQKIIEESNELLSNEKKIIYVEDGIIRPLCVYLAKFSSLVFDCSGYDYIHFYELLYYFLEMKIYIYEHKEDYTSNISKKIAKNVFRNKLNSWGNSRKSLIRPDISKEDIKDIKDDLEKMKKTNFEILNFSLMNQIFTSHLNTFIEQPKINGLKDIFEKKKYVYSDEQIEKKKTYLINNNQLKTPFEKTIFEIVIKYFNEKTSLEHCSFIKMLNDDNMYFNCKCRILLIKNILFFMSNFNYESTYREQCLWEIFRLLQYDTGETQKSCLELLDKKSKLLNFDYLLQNFTINLMSILNREINPCITMIKHDYYLTLMIVKILKYFCEEHNQDFQRIFFIKEDDGIILHYNPKQYELLDNMNEVDRYNESDNSTNDNLINSISKNEIINSNNISNANVSNSNNLNNTNNNVLILSSAKNKKPNPDSECENLHEVTRSEENFKEIQKNKASVFEYMLSILSKIILLSKWINSKDEDNLDDYFYDLYFVILEFLIETIQGTRCENLQTVFQHDQSNGNRNLFGVFLLEINRLMLEENDTELSYQVRKDMMDFLMAFLEESATPENGIIEISSVIIPISILESIVSTMSKLYDIKTADDPSVNKIDDKENLSQTRTMDRKSYKFSPVMKKYFTDLYFNDLELGEDIRFALANRMFQFFKLYSIEDSFRNPAVCEFYDKMEMLPEPVITKFYYSQNKNILNDDKTTLVTDAKFFENYFCVSFFESITRIVFVNKPSSDKPVRVLFTLNPVVPLLSKISKEDFIDNVDRSDRYIKLLSLVESCDYFFEEVSYKQSSGKNNILIRLITDLNFYWLEVFAFIITLTINIVMVCTLKGVGDAFYGDQHINNVIDDLGLVNFIYNCIALLLWLYSKFNLFYLTECQKMLKKKKNEQSDESAENDEEVTLTLSEKMYAVFVVLVLKNKLFGFIWNIAFSAGGHFSDVYFLYIIQLFSIVNLSQTLRNLILSLTVKANQLCTVFYFTIILNLVFAAIAFFNFSQDFIKAIDSKPPKVYPSEFDFMLDLVGAPYIEPSHIENECGTLLYCFCIHLDYGMRFDGGIADRMEKASYTFEQSYYVARFFYEEFYFISLVVLMLNMIFGIIIEAFSELRNNEQAIDKDKREICFICGIDKESCEKKGEKLQEHLEKVHNIWTYVEYILGLRFVDIQETNAINSYVIENLERKELMWFPYDETKTGEEDSKDQDRD